MRVFYISISFTKKTDFYRFRYFAFYNLKIKIKVKINRRETKNKTVIVIKMVKFDDKNADEKRGKER